MTQIDDLRAALTDVGTSIEDLKGRLGPAAEAAQAQITELQTTIDALVADNANDITQEMMDPLTATAQALKANLDAIATAVVELPPVDVPPVQ